MSHFGNETSTSVEGNRERTMSLNHARPFFSVIIPTCRRPRQLATCVRSLSSLDYPRDRFEVIVVDDGDDETLGRVIEPFRSALEIRLIRQANAGPAVARNTGGMNARGEFLAFTDDDCEPSQDWLTVLAAGFRENPDAMLGGRTINVLTDNLYSTASQLLVDFLYGYYNADALRAVFLRPTIWRCPQVGSTAWAGSTAGSRLLRRKIANFATAGFRSAIGWSMLPMPSFATRML